MTTSSVPPPMVPSARDRVVQVAGCFKLPGYPNEVCRAADAIKLVNDAYLYGWNTRGSDLAIQYPSTSSVLPTSNLDVQMPPGAAVPPGAERGKLKCTECGWTGMEEDIDRVQDPGSHEVWQVCRHCRAPEHFVLVCDEPGCRLTVTCGTPLPDGYRQTCGMHRPRAVPPSGEGRDAEVEQLRQERDEYRAKAYELAEAEGELKENCARLEAINTLLARRPDGHKEPCLICGEPCSSLAGNPSLWPVRLGNDGWHHVGCINKELAELARLKTSKPK